jgi:hypothetical protein
VKDHYARITELARRACREEDNERLIDLLDQLNQEFEADNAELRSEINAVRDAREQLTLMLLPTGSNRLA